MRMQGMHFDPGPQRMLASPYLGPSPWDLTDHQVVPRSRKWAQGRAGPHPKPRREGKDQPRAVGLSSLQSFLSVSQIRPARPRK